MTDADMVRSLWTSLMRLYHHLISLHQCVECIVCHDHSALAEGGPGPTMTLILTNVLGTEPPIQRPLGTAPDHSQCVEWSGVTSRHGGSGL